MNTLTLLCGMGIGALIATIILLVVLILCLRPGKALQTRNAKHMETTERLMEERNEIDLSVLKAVIRIANANEAMLRGIDEMNQPPPLVEFDDATTTTIKPIHS